MTAVALLLLLAAVVVYFAGTLLLALALSERGNCRAPLRPGCRCALRRGHGGYHVCGVHT